MSSQQGGSKVRVKVPKVRRNSGEVRPYTELPRAQQSWDQMLLWGTALGLFGVMLAGAGLMWYQGRAPRIEAPPEHLSVTLKPPALLEEARQFYIHGDYGRATSQARVALALERAQPSEPPLEKPIRRLLALAYEHSGKLPEALSEWQWIRAHHPTPEDLQHFRKVQAAVARTQEHAALEQLRGAQTLLTRAGNEQKALSEAQRALRTLEAHRATPSSLQAAHLLVANIALQQNQPLVALDSLRQAARYGRLSAKHQQLLSRLTGVQNRTVAQPTRAQSRQLQVQVVIPRLAEEPAYPRSQPYPAARSPRRSSPAPAMAEEFEAGPASAGAGRAPSAPKVELPKIEMRTGDGNALPSYQDRSGNTLPTYQGRSGDSLPTYSNKSRSRDTLPGY